MTIEELDKLAPTLPGTWAHINFTTGLEASWPALRSAIMAAKEWLKAADAAHWTKAAVSAEECQAREALREKLKELGL